MIGIIISVAVIIIGAIVLSRVLDKKADGVETPVEGGAAAQSYKVDRYDEATFSDSTLSAGVILALRLTLAESVTFTAATIETGALSATRTLEVVLYDDTGADTTPNNLLGSLGTVAYASNSTLVTSGGSVSTGGAGTFWVAIKADSSSGSGNIALRAENLVTGDKVRAILSSNTFPDPYTGPAAVEEQPFDIILTGTPD